MLTDTSRNASGASSPYRYDKPVTVATVTPSVKPAGSQQRSGIGMAEPAGCKPTRASRNEDRQPADAQDTLRGQHEVEQRRPDANVIQYVGGNQRQRQGGDRQYQCGGDDHDYE